MKIFTWEIKIGLSLVILSSIIYTLKYFTLGDPLNTYMYVFNAGGFLPLNVLFVTMVINKLLSVRAQRDRLEKINMVIGMFYSELGTEMLARLSHNDPGVGKIKDHLLVSEGWTDKNFNSVKKIISAHHYQTDDSNINFAMLHHWLSSKRDFILRLLENPALLEHGPFTELLRAMSHLMDELSRRSDFTTLPETDLNHLFMDLNRVYRHLVIQWLGYMHYLKKNYPYLFSFAMRVNPFDENASPVVGEQA
ncbi:MAG: hypothetical protein PHY77_08085 [Desulfotomaculaceae bacterium]|nr:hypothetical protein [Desulfotomaculaceae bacterium]